MVVGGAYLLFRPDSAVVPEESRYMSAPDFALPNESGALVRLSEVEGTIRIVNFWASWSPYSKDELLAFDRLKKKYGDTLVVIALDRDTTTNDGRVFIKTLGISQDILFVFDKKDEYFDTVQGYAVPETLFLDKDGAILEHVHGPLTYERMEEIVTSLLTNKG